jgi:hypothetical protein
MVQMPGWLPRMGSPTTGTPCHSASDTASIEHVDTTARVRGCVSTATCGP